MSFSCSALEFALIGWAQGTCPPLDQTPWLGECPAQTGWIQGHPSQDPPKPLGLRAGADGIPNVRRGGIDGRLHPENCNKITCFQFFMLIL